MRRRPSAGRTRAGGPRLRSRCHPDGGGRRARAPRPPPSAVEIGRVFGLPITNSMVVSWVVALGLIVFAQVATRNMEQVPSGAQNFLEWLVAGLYGLLEGILGPHLVKRTFWFFATVFIFILAANWVGLVPGVGTIGWGHHGAARLHGRPAPAARGQRRPQPDPGHGASSSSRSGSTGRCAEVGPRRDGARAVRAQGRDRGVDEAPDGRRVLRRGLPGDHLDPVPSRLAELPPLRQRLRRRDHAGDDGHAGARAAAGCCRFPSTSWSCWWASSRPSSSCC